MQKYGFIYITTNSVNGKRYIGQTSFKRGEKKNDCYLGSGKYLHEAIRKYGRENFSREILFIASSFDNLNWAERHFILEFNAVKSREFYNVSPGGRASLGFTGKKHSESRNSNLSERFKGKSRPPEVREKLKWSNEKRANHLENMSKPERQAVQKKVAQKMGESNSHTITLNGVTYASKKVACIELNISHEILIRRLQGLPDQAPRKTRVPFTQEQKDAMRAKRKPRLNLVCPHCSKTLDPGNYAKNHGNKCKMFMS